MIELPDLPYARDALEPAVSKNTIDFHYGKHHQKYVDNVNKLVEGTPYETKDVDVIIKDSTKGALFDNAAQVWNHTFFWNSMSPNKEDNELDEETDLYKAITKKYGSYDKFKTEFTNAATKVFGSGWIWLTQDQQYVNIETTRNANQVSTRPLLVCDLWEHSYYLDYQNDRAKYIENFFKVINWQFAVDNWKK